MILVDIITKQKVGEEKGVWAIVTTIPNGEPLPNNLRVRQENNISPDEARHLLQTKYAGITQPKC